MKKTIQVHIGGRQFSIDEDAYHAIRDYLDALKIHFSEEADSAKEIIEDIELRIAELFQEKLTSARQAITLSDVKEVIEVMGNSEDMDFAELHKTDYDDYDRRDHRRLFRDPDNEGRTESVCQAMRAFASGL